MKDQREDGGAINTRITSKILFYSSVLFKLCSLSENWIELQFRYLGMKLNGTAYPYILLVSLEVVLKQNAF